MKKIIFLIVVAVALLALLAGRILYVNAPQKSDAIVVLAGGRNDNRYYKGLELLRAGYAARMYLDAEADDVMFGHPATYFAERFIQESAGSDAGRVKVCPTRGDSTRSEASYVLRCAQADSVHSILVVTSDYHTRRARSVFEKVAPGYRISVAAAADTRFNLNWWHDRESAKVAWQEWQKLIFWECVERWRKTK